MTSLYMSIPILVWLFVCAWFDWKSRRVSNWMTLPALALGLLIRILGYGWGNWRFVCLLSALLLLGWSARLVGGADAKASLAMTFLDPRLSIWAWIGAILLYFAFFIHPQRIERQVRIPGMLGFALGIFAYAAVILVN